MCKRSIIAVFLEAFIEDKFLQKKTADWKKVKHIGGKDPPLKQYGCKTWQKSIPMYNLSFKF